MIIGTIFVVVVAAFIWRSFNTVRTEATQDDRGSTRKDGYHIIHSEYSSGVSGHHTTYKIPCDPDEYARFFIPKKTDTKK
jgi:hypothetical protein